MSRDQDELVALLREGLADERAHELREELADAIPRRLAENGLRLSVHHTLDHDGAGLGFATITEMTAELGEAAAALFAKSLWYPGAALVRQLIECGYLIALAGERREEASEWMASSREQIVAQFMPRQMRARSMKNFSVSEYQAHCDRGGHPNPVGRELLRHHDDWRTFSARSLWTDLALHLVEIWNSFSDALRLYDPRLDPHDALFNPGASPEGREEIERLIARWREHDPLADRIPLPDLEDN